jgi:hypothetical protein
MTESSFDESDHDHDLCAAELMARAERACARHNARLTSLRRDVLEAVGESHRAAGAYEIIERLARTARGRRRSRSIARWNFSASSGSSTGSKAATPLSPATACTRPAGRC